LVAPGQVAGLDPVRMESNHASPAVADDHGPAVHDPDEVRHVPGRFRHLLKDFGGLLVGCLGRLKGLDQLLQPLQQGEGDVLAHLR